MNRPTKVSRYPVRLGIVVITVTLSGCGRPPESVAAGMISELIARSYGDLFDPPKNTSASGYPSNICGQKEISKFLESSISYNDLSHKCRIADVNFQRKYIIVRTNVGKNECENIKKIFHERIAGIRSEYSFEEKDKIQWKYNMGWLLNSYRVDDSCKNGVFEFILAKT